MSVRLWRGPVLIAYRCSTEDRARAHAYTGAWWRDHGFTVFEAEGPRVGPFNISAAFNEAARAAGDWSVALLTGTDVLPEDAAQVHRAMERAEATGRLVHAATEWARLDRAATEAIYAGAAPSFEMADHAQPRKLRGLKAVPRALHDAIGGHDEAFVGYHGEDLAFNARCAALAGEEWLPGYAVHLWHAEDRRKTEARQVRANSARLARVRQELKRQGARRPA